MVSYSKEKKRLLSQIRREVFPRYSQLVHAGTLTLSGDDDSVVRIVFAKGNLAHLCGFEVFTTQDKTSRDRQSRFYDFMQSDGPLPLRRIDFAHHHDWRATSLETGLRNSDKKIRVAPVAFDALLSGLAEQEAYIVQSAKSSVAIFVGDTGWALGLKLQDGMSNDYVPVSLLDESVLSSLVHRSGSAVVRVTGAEWC